MGALRKYIAIIILIALLYATAYSTVTILFAIYHNELAPTTSCTLTVDASVDANTMLVLAVTSRDAGGGSPSVSNLTNGAWTKIGNDANQKGTLWYIRGHDNDAGATVTVSGATGSCAAIIVAYYNVDWHKSRVPYNTVYVEGNASGDESMTGITTTKGGSRVVLAIFNTGNDNSVTNTVSTDPSVYLMDMQVLSTGGLDCAVGIWSETRQTAGATGNVTWAQTNGATISMLFEIYTVVGIGPGGAHSGGGGYIF